MASVRRAARVREGVTLVELSVALTVTGLVALLATGLFAVMSDAALHANAGAREFLRQSAQRRLLTDLLTSAELDSSYDSFSGWAGGYSSGALDRLSFSLEPGRPLAAGAARRVFVRQARHGVGMVEMLVGVEVFDDSISLPILRDSSARGVRIEYLIARERSSRWLRGWISDAALPVAVRFTSNEVPAQSAVATFDVPLIAVVQRFR